MKNIITSLVILIFINCIFAEKRAEKSIVWSDIYYVGNKDTCLIVVDTSSDNSTYFIATRGNIRYYYEFKIKCTCVDSISSYISFHDAHDLYIGTSVEIESRQYGKLYGKIMINNNKTRILDIHRAVLYERKIKK